MHRDVYHISSVMEMNIPIEHSMHFVVKHPNTDIIVICKKWYSVVGVYLTTVMQRSV